MLLVYRIQKKEPNTLLVRLEEKGSKRVLYLDHLKMAADEADKAALSFLVSIHRKAPNVSRNLDTASFQEIEVPASLSNEAIRLMIKTGRLFFKEKALSYHPISANLSWKGEKLSLGFSLEAFIGDLPLVQADLVFPGEPYWMIHQGVFRALTTNVSWKWIERFLSSSLLLQGAQAKKFLEEEPIISWKEKEEKPLEVFPQLVLQDGTGCFAHLWMDYRFFGKIAFEDPDPRIQGKARLKETEEQWEKDLLETGFIRKAVGTTRYFCPSDQVHAALLFLLEIGWHVIDAKGKTVLRQTGFELKIQQKNEGAFITGSVRFQDKEAKLPSEKKRLWCDIDDHFVGLFDHKALEPAASFLQEALKEEDGFFLPRQKLSLLASWVDHPEVLWQDQLKQTALEFAQKPSSLPPDPSFQGLLLPYQQTGLDWLCHLHRLGFSGLLADEMGLGKTVQVLAFFSRLRTKLPILIVAPTSLLVNWKRECARFLPHIEPYIHSGSDRILDVAELQKFSVVITSYALLRQDEEVLTQIDYEAAVLDESQAIKNADTRSAKAAMLLKSRFRLCLSGTPMENRTDEFVSQFQFLLPNLLSRSDSIAQLKRKSGPFLLRRRKKDVDLELPEKREQILWLEMTKPQEDLYRSFQSQYKRGLLQKVEKDGASKHRLEILEAILRLRQICADPRLLDGDALGAKAQMLQEEILEIAAENRKVLVFSQFTSLLAILRKDLASFHPLYLDGSMSHEERGSEVEKFQRDEHSSLFLLSLKAGGSGLNLTAADTVILIDPWWNDAVEQQAIGRVHRLGQTKKILAKRYLTPNSIEEKILSLKEKKLSDVNLLLETGDESAEWSAEDLLSLLL